MQIRTLTTALLVLVLMLASAGPANALFDIGGAIQRAQMIVNQATQIANQIGPPKLSAAVTRLRTAADPPGRKSAGSAGTHSSPENTTGRIWRCTYGPNEWCPSAPMTGAWPSPTVWRRSFWAQDSDGKLQMRKVDEVRVNRLIAERTSRAVKDALQEPTRSASAQHGSRRRQESLRAGPGLCTEAKAARTRSCLMRTSPLRGGHRGPGARGDR